MKRATTARQAERTTQSVAVDRLENAFPPAESLFTGGRNRGEQEFVLAAVEFEDAAREGLRGDGDVTAPLSKPRWRRWAEHTATRVLLTTVLIAGLWWSASWSQVGRVMLGLDTPWLLAALALFIPQTLISGIRWRRITRSRGAVSLGEAVSHVLVGSAFNLIVPCKGGDLMRPSREAAGVTRRVRSMFQWTVSERAADMFTLGVAVGCGLLGWTYGLETAAAATFLLLALVSRPRFGAPAAVNTSLATLGWTLILWRLHLLQIHWFMLSAGVDATFAQSLARAPAALLAGVLPLGWCGIGPRDVTLAWMYGDLAAAAPLAAVGLLTALRYLIPGAAGIAILACGDPYRQRVSNLGGLGE